ncbi:MAG TPA: hypothetical protein VGC36_13765, partial [Rhizomicrobium sp.]
GRAKPRPKTDTAAASDGGGLFSGWGLGRSTPSAAPTADARTGEEEEGFLGWSLGPAKPKPKTPSSDGGYFSGWTLGPSKPSKPSGTAASPGSGS